ncbi:hypothetical protein KDA11_04080 [Candidatus Saccharibacteria bacterium]|nr:hypothetical protein [Candidatus Saccharibacteria bacterium]
MAFPMCDTSVIVFATSSGDKQFFIPEYQRNASHVIALHNEDIERKQEHAITIPNILPTKEHLLDCLQLFTKNILEKKEVAVNTVEQYIIGHYLFQEVIFKADLELQILLAQAGIFDRSRTKLLDSTQRLRIINQNSELITPFLNDKKAFKKHIMAYPTVFKNVDISYALDAFPGKNIADKLQNWFNIKFNDELYGLYKDLIYCPISWFCFDHKAYVYKTNLSGILLRYFLNPTYTVFRTNKRRFRILHITAMPTAFLYDTKFYLRERDTIIGSKYYGLEWRDGVYRHCFALLSPVD